MSNNLNLPQIAENQTHKEITSNDADGALDAALTELLSIDATDDVTLTNSQYRGAMFFRVSVAGVGKKITLPQIKRLCVFSNVTANSVDLVRGSTTVTVPAGAMAVVYTDGTTDGLVSRAIADAGAEQPVDMLMFFPGVPTAAATLMRLVASFAFTLPASLTGSKATAATASSGTAVFTLKRNGSSIGTITFTSSATGTFSFASDVNVAVNDVLLLEAPNPADSTLADVSISLHGSK